MSIKQCFTPASPPTSSPAFRNTKPKNTTETSPPGTTSSISFNYQSFPTIEEAIAEEKRIKGGSRQQKCLLINSINPQWKDLWDEDVSKW